MKANIHEHQTAISPREPRNSTGTNRELELWGGLECTYNRVHDSYFSQMEWNGHLNRPEDLDLFAEVGLKAIRYPVIWEMLAPYHLDAIDWTFPDQRLPRLQELGVRPIAGLVHHGSGPLYAPIDQPEFAEGLARYAGAVAQRYPWIDAYTPVNEPLTTARFCGLYGHWYPHGTGKSSFVPVLANECRATILAMRAIRQVNSQAQLIQTDDLGHIYSTPRLAYQAEYENHRRWLGWDLLCGKVDTDHPLWAYLLQHGLTEAELHWFGENSCPPDVLGINHYPTSDRYLDENTALYPNVQVGTNGCDTYADVEAVRVRPNSPGGFHERLMEAWERYRLPMAITESHLGCTREEQIRWFAESWKAAQRARLDGADVRAVTAWSLLGAFNWNTLVTRDVGFYEPGVFDVRSSKPRPTAIANLLGSLGAGEEPDHPALHQPGWWHRPNRLFEAHRSSLPANPDSALALPKTSCSINHDKSNRPLLVLGANGVLGRAFAASCEVRGLEYQALTRQDLDLSDAMTVEVALEQVRPWAVINAAGYSRPEDAENDEQGCFAVNTQAAVHLASACERSGAALLCFSSAHVFDGQQQRPYLESDTTAPLNVLGRSKAAMEESVLQALPHTLVVRTDSCFGSGDSSGDSCRTLSQTLRALAQGESVDLPEDVMVSPTYIPDMVDAAFDLLIDRAEGIWHLANDGAINLADFVRTAAQQCGISDETLQPCSHHDLAPVATQPIYAALGSERGQILPHLESALSRYARQFKL